MNLMNILATVLNFFQLLPVTLGLVQAQPIYQPPFENARQAFYTSLESKPWADVANEQIQALKAEEKALKEEFLQLIGLTEEQWLKEKNDLMHSEVYKNLVKRDSEQATEINPECKAAVQKKLTELGFDTTAIEFLGCSKHHFNEVCQSDNCKLMYVLQKQFFISNSWKDSLDTDIFRFTLGHEAQHLMHDDSFTRTCMQAIFASPDLKIEQAVKDSYLKRYSHFVEKRADILSCLIDISHVHNYFEYLKPMRNSEHDTNTTPSLKTSFDYTTVVYNEMNKHAAVVA